MWIPILLTTMVAVLVVGEVVVLEDKVIQVVDTLVDQEEEVRVKRGAVDHEEGSGAGLLGSSFPDYGIDDEDQVKLQNKCLLGRTTTNCRCSSYNKHLFCSLTWSSSSIP